MKSVTMTACLIAAWASAAGCGPSASPKEDLTLVGQMRRRGISHLDTRKVVIRGSEGCYGADTIVVATEGFIIQKIWDTIYMARPYHTWAASGYREIEFYHWEKDPEPVVVLRLNVTDEAHFRGQTAKEGFRCPGLSEYLTGLLKRAYEKRKRVKNPEDG